MATYRLEFDADGEPILVEDEMADLTSEPLGKILSGSDRRELLQEMLMERYGATGIDD